MGAFDQLNGVLEANNGLVFVLLGVLTVAENASELLQNLPVLRLRIDTCLVSLSGIREETFLLEQVADLLKNQAVFDAELFGAMESETSLLKSLLAELQAQDCVQSPALRICVVKDVCLVNGIFSLLKFVKTDE